MYTQAARIPGFRAGRAPRDLVRRRYAKEIEDEVKERLIPDGYQGAVKQENLHPVAVLGVHDVKFNLGQPMTFSVTLDIPPEFTLPAYKGLVLERKKVEVADTDVDEALKSLVEQSVRWQEVTDRPAQRGDLVQIDYEGFCENKPLEERAPKAAGLGKGKDFWMLADENAFLPGFADGLAGAKIGEKRQVLVDFPADFAEPTVAGRRATYFVDVKALREKKLPAPGDELAKSLGLGSADEVRTRVREDLLKHREELETRRQKGELMKALLAATKLDVPESVVIEETRDTVYDIVRQNSYRGVSREQIEQNKNQIFEQASRSASEKVKLRYILHRIAEQEKIEASSEEVSARIVEMAAQYNVTPPEFRAELEKRKALDGLAEDIRANKTLDFLLAQAKIKL
jgi:trigger factor